MVLVTDYFLFVLDKPYRDGLFGPHVYRRANYKTQYYFKSTSCKFIFLYCLYYIIAK